MNTKPIWRAQRAVLPWTRFLRPAARRSVARVSERFFDPAWYASRNGLTSVTDARNHYVAVGAWIGLAPHPLLDPAWLCGGTRVSRARRPGPLSRSRAVLRYTRTGGVPGEDPHPLVDVTWYRDIANLSHGSELDPLTHFLLSGESAGLSPHPLIDAKTLRREFESRAVALSATETGAETALGRSPLTAYAAGLLLDARTHELFDGAAYRRLNPDVDLAGVVPLEHYLRSGREEGRATLLGVDEDWARARWGVEPQASFDPLELTRSLSNAALEEARSAMEEVLRHQLAEFLNQHETASVLVQRQHHQARITVIVPVWNQAHATLGCLRALQEACAGLSVTVHVVDNGSTDETSSLLARFHGLTVTRWEENRGFGAAINHAAELAETELLLLLNSDAFVDAAAIKNALAVLDEQPDAGAVCGRIVLPNGMLQEAGSYVMPDGSARGYLRGAPAAHPAALHRRDVDFGSAAFLLIRRDIFVGLGGFRSEFGLAYGEDADLMLRMWTAGWRTVYEPRCLVQHLEGSTGERSAQAALQMAHAASVIAESHAELLLQRSERAGDLTQSLPYARVPGQRFVVIDDEVPSVLDGAGQPRAIAILNELISGMGASVTLLTAPMNRSESVRRTWRDRANMINPTIEVLPGLTPDLWVDWLDANRERVDLVWVSRSPNMQVLWQELRRRGRSRLDIPTVFDCEAIVTPRNAALAAHLGDPWPDELFRSRQQDEIACSSAADVTVCVSEDDADTYRDYGAVVQVVGHRFPVIHHRKIAPNSKKVLFVGRLVEPDSPNSLGLRWFLTNVWPRVQQRSAARLDIIGSTGDWTRTIKDPSVTVRGTVAQLDDEYLSARVFVAPTFFAAGIAHKVQEAGAFGVPVVTTSLIAGQLRLRHSSEAMVGENATDFADAIFRLLTDNQLWCQISLAASARVAGECDSVRFSSSVDLAVCAARNRPHF